MTGSSHYQPQSAHCCHLEAERDKVKLKDSITRAVVQEQFESFFLQGDIRNSIRCKTCSYSLSWIIVVHLNFFALFQVQSVDVAAFNKIWPRPLHVFMSCLDSLLIVSTVKNNNNNKITSCTEPNFSVSHILEYFDGGLRADGFKISCLAECGIEPFQEECEKDAWGEGCTTKQAYWTALFFFFFNLFR